MWWQRESLQKEKKENHDENLLWVGQRKNGALKGKERAVREVIREPDMCWHMRAKGEKASKRKKSTMLENHKRGEQIFRWHRVCWNISDNSIGWIARVEVSVQLWIMKLFNGERREINRTISPGSRKVERLACLIWLLVEFLTQVINTKITQMIT